MPAKTDVKLSTLSYVIIYVKDTAKTLPFYRDTLGLKVRVDEHGWVELETGAVTVALHADEHHKGESHNGPVPTFSVENVVEVYEGLKAKGVKFEKDLAVACEGEGGKVGKCAEFRDPDGNRLSIFGYTAK